MMEFEFPKYNLDVDFDDDTGFPFDNTPHSSTTSAHQEQQQQQPPTTNATFGGRDDSRLRFEDHLRDIAARYPEFAEHIRPSADSGGGGSLRGFPNSTRERAERRGDPWGRDDFGDFGRDFDIPPEFARESRFARPREFYPPNTQIFSTTPPPFQSDSRPPVYPQSAAPPQTPPNPPQHTPTPVQPKAATVAPTAAQPHQGIQQSNTVDLGQVQPPGSAEAATEGRGQRSMSAPPTDGGTGTAAAGKRYVSSIQIPVLQQTGTQSTGQEDMGASNSAPKVPQQPQQTPNKPNEYVIPIHIEGRDEPIVPKQTNQYMQQQEPSATGQTQPLFNTMKDQFKQQQEQVQREQQQKYYEQQQKDAELEQPRPQIVKPMPLEMIQLIQKDVSELMSRVEKFAGKPKDKDYVYLDEMLTRNLLKLDDIETEGKDTIRQARREAIKCIEGCISILEAKAKQNAAKDKMPTIEDKTNVQEQGSRNVGVLKSSSNASNKEDVKTEKENESEVKNTSGPEISNT